MSANETTLPVPAAKRLPPVPARRSRHPVRHLSDRLRTIVETREDHEFLPAHLEILDSPPSPFAVGFIWVLCGLFAAALTWSCFAKIDIFATATGRIQPNGHSKVVQPLQTSRVKAVLTENGAPVATGAPLLELDTTAPQADLDAKRTALASLEAQVVRFRSAIDAVREEKDGATVEFPADVTPGIAAQERAAMQADINQYLSTRQSLIAQLAEKTAMSQQYTTSIAARGRLAAVLQARADIKQALVDKSSGTKTALIDAQQQVEQASADLAYDQGQLAQAQAGATSIQRRMEQWKSETLAKQQQSLADALEKRAGAVQDVIKAQYLLSQTSLASPIDGTVQQLAVTSVGQIVSAGQPLLVVVPSNGPIDIEALVPNKDIGFVTAGQDAVIKIDAFPYTRYGTIDGKVENVSHDAINMRDAANAADAESLARGGAISPASGTPDTQNLFFPVAIHLNRSTVFSEGHDVPLTPGMTASVEIRTGSRRVIDYLLAPIRETTSAAGHER